MSKQFKKFGKSRRFEQIKHRDLPKYRREHEVRVSPDHAPRPAAPMTTITPREEPGDGQAHESKPAPVVMVFQSELDYISRCILDCPRIETGGQLFGHWTATGIPVVEYAIGPGPRANHQTTFFNQDVDYLVRVGQTLVERFGLQHIGEWHSHHQLGLARPSGHDAATMVNNIARQHLRRFLLCIGNCDNRGNSTLNAFTFHEDHQYHFEHSPWHVLTEPVSPYRQRIDVALAGILRHPQTVQARHSGMLLTRQAATTKPEYDVNYWLNDKRNNQVLKRILDQLPMLDRSAPCQVQPKLDENQHLHLLVQRGTQREHIYFPAAFPHVPPEIRFETSGIEHYPGANAPDTTPAATAGIVWTYDGQDIYRAFMDYYKQLF